MAGGKKKMQQALPSSKFSGDNTVEAEPAVQSPPLVQCPFKKGERVQCGKRANPEFSDMQLSYLRRHCFLCRREFDTQKQLKQHNDGVHGRAGVHGRTKECDFCANRFRSHECKLHDLQMQSWWNSFSKE